jgi:MFS family permease
LLTQPWFGRQADRRGRPVFLLLGTVGFVSLLTLAGAVAQYGPRTPLLVGIGVGAFLALGYGPAALASLADVSHSLTRGTTMAVYSLVISLGMIVGLVVSTALYSAYRVPGLDAFFAIVAVGLVVLTYLRLNDLRRESPEGPSRSTPGS